MTEPRTLIRCPQCEWPGDPGCRRCGGEAWVTPQTMAEHWAALGAALRVFVREVVASIPGGVWRLRWVHVAWWCVAWVAAFAASMWWAR